MEARIALLAEQLLLIERELRALGWWEQEPPNAEALASQEPFCVDSLRFEQWLQWILLPRMKQLLEDGATLPTASGIQEMGAMVYREQPTAVRQLLIELGVFDRLLVRAH